jgi:hypothetical protein
MRASHVWVFLGLLPLLFGAPAAAAEEPASSPPRAESAAGKPPEKLPDVVVVGERNGDAVSKITVTGQELKQVPGSGGDPLRALQTFPGVTVNSDTSAAPAIRGTSPEDNLYYVDGLPVGYMFHFGGVFSVLNADLVQDFAFYPSAFGPEFDNALGGVIDVRLREPRSDRFGAKVNINLYESDFLVEGPVAAGHSYYFGARRSYFDLILPKSGTLDKDEGIEYRKFPSFYDYQGKYLWLTESHGSLSLQISGAADKSELYVPPTSSIAARDPVLAGTAVGKTRYDSQGAVWRTGLTESTNNRLALAHLRSRVDQSVGTLGRLSADFDTLSLRDEVTLRPAAAHQVLLGASYLHTVVDFDLDFHDPRCTEFDPACDFTSAPRVQRKDRLRFRETALYAKDRWRLHDKFTLLAGARLSREDYLKEFFAEPRVGAEWQIAPRTRLSAGWGKYHQFPDGAQVLPEIGNPNLSNLRAQHSVLGVLQQFDHRWSWSTELYYKKLDDLVVADDALQYLNAGSGRVYGVDVLIRKDLTDRISGWASLTLARSERTHEGTQQTIRSNFDQPVVFNLVGNYKLPRDWTLGAAWRYHSGAAYTPIVGGVLRPGSTTDYLPVHGATNSARFPPYHRLDLRLGRDFAFRGWKLNTYVELINAYNRKNVDEYRYSRDFSSREPVYQLPRLISFGVQGEF